MTFSDLLQRPSETVQKLQQSTRHALQLRRRGQDEDLVLITLDKARQDDEIVAVAVRVLRTIASDPVLRSHHLLDLMPAVFPWVRFLPEGDRAQYAQELVDVLQASAEIDNFVPALNVIAEWRHTAEIYADPELLSALQEPGGSGTRSTTSGTRSM